MTVHSFQQRLDEGIDGEQFLDWLFMDRFDYQIRPASQAEQRQGIDRWFLLPSDQSQRWFAVEYKTDHQAFRTGNAFVETVSVDTAGKRGWAFTSRSRYVCYFLPEADLVYVLRSEVIRCNVADWQRQFPTRPAHNDGYDTLGVLVPLAEFERLADQVIETNDVPLE